MQSHAVPVMTPLLPRRVQPLVPQAEAPSDVSNASRQPAHRWRLQDVQSSAALPASAHAGPSRALAQQRIQRFIATHLTQGVTLKELARFPEYSEKYSPEYFQHHMGTRFSRYVRNLRIAVAIHLLAGDATVTEIATSLGFSDAFAFRHFFKRTVGCSPSAFRHHRLVPSMTP